MSQCDAWEIRAANSNISDSISAMAFTLGVTVDLCMTCMHAHARFDDLDLDARSQWAGKGNQSALNYLDH